MVSCFITCHKMYMEFLMRRFKVLALLFLRIQVLWDMTFCFLMSGS